MRMVGGLATASTHTCSGATLAFGDTGHSWIQSHGATVLAGANLNKIVTLVSIYHKFGLGN